MIEAALRRQRRYWLLAAVAMLAGLAVLAATWLRADPRSDAAVTASTVTVAAHAPAVIGAGPWERVSLPVPVASVDALAAAPDDLSTLYDCTARLPSALVASQTGPSPATLWRTTDAGAHWQGTALPHASGGACQITIAPDDPARLGVDVYSTDKGTQPCAGESTLLSEDRGVSWHVLTPPPAPATTPSTYSGCTLRVTARHVFLLYVLGTASQQVSMLQRSDDNGAHWARADTGLTADSLFTILQVGPNDAVAMLVAHPWSVEQPHPTELMVSDDAGKSWRVSGQLPDGVGTFLLGAEPARNGPWPSISRPFYALSQEQIPSDLYREGAFSSVDGRQWQPLPALPVPGASVARRGMLQALAALPDGRLAIWGTDPATGVPAQDSVHEPLSAFWLWLWDPTAQTWHVVPEPMAATQEEGCGLCWQAQAAIDASGTTYLYVASTFASPLSAPPGVFRIRLASAA